MSLVLQSSGGGSVTLNEPTTASNFTVTLPAATGTAMVSGNQPAFSVWRNGDQTGITSGVSTKVQLNTEIFDTASAFDSTTNYRFQPTVAGYYQLSGCVDVAGTGLTYGMAQLFKNGSDINHGSFSAGATSEFQSSISLVVYLNGSTDYVELYALAFVTAGTFTINATQPWQSYFTGVLVRTA